MSGKKVEAITGVEATNIRHFASSTGFLKGHNTHWKTTKKQREEIRRMYCQERYSAKQIAKQLGIPKSRVHTFLDREGIARPISKAMKVHHGRKRAAMNLNKK